MNCAVCNSKLNKAFKGQILHKYDIDYYFCPICEHLQTEQPFWIEEAYGESITKEDVGILKRNMDIAISLSVIIGSYFDKGAKFLDWAGGYGILCRLMRDIGFDFVWDDKYTKNLFARGFEYKKEDKIELVSAIEVMEHLEFPMDTLSSIFKISDNLFFTQSILPIPLRTTDKWWYYAPGHGQHISFYTKKTLQYMAKSFNKNYVSYKDFHLFCNKNIDENDFIKTMQNEILLYSESVKGVVSKIGSDMEYVKKTGAVAASAYFRD